jgi:hypothetical protein
LKKEISEIDPRKAATLLNCPEEETEFFSRLFVIDRMGRENDFKDEVVKEYNKQI